MMQPRKRAGALITLRKARDALSDMRDLYFEAQHGFEPAQSASLNVTKLPICVPGAQLAVE